MKKQDLKTGMRLIFRNRDEYIVLKKVKNPYGTVEDMYVRKKGGYMNENSYNDDLTCTGNDRDYDVMEVYAQHNGDYLDAAVISCDIKDMDLIWKREEKKEMTISEIEKELGYSIKIVKEKY